ncbi:MAG: hypothetical protein NWF01_03475 [Candidatus Bathyarchaeota archaeon]|nr:hypothetical protein [Candidatus Bathyarchaeota archaeon]
MQFNVLTSATFSIKKTFTIILVLLLLFSASLVELTFSASSTEQQLDLQVKPLSSFPSQMAASAYTENGTLFAGDYNYTIYRSDDDGLSFRKIYTIPPEVNPQSDRAGIVWTLFINSKNNLFVSVPSTNKLYRSSNFGASFNVVLNTNGTQKDGFFSAVTEGTNGTLYTATYGKSAYPEKPAVLKSTDNGATWTKTAEFAAASINNIKVNPQNNYLYAITSEYTPDVNNSQCERVFRSKDNGTTWTTVINRPTELQTYGNTIYTAILFSGDHVYLGSSQPLKPNWIDSFNDDGSDSPFTPATVYTFPLTCNFPVLSATKLNQTMLFSSTVQYQAGTSQIIASTNGTTWKVIKSQQLTVAQNYTNILTSNSNYTIFSSTDTDQNFVIKNVPITMTQNIAGAWIAQDGTLYASVDNSLYNSTDYGQTWSSAMVTIPLATQLSGLFVDSNGTIYFSPAGRIGLDIDPSVAGIWRSTDQGQTWERTQTLSIYEFIFNIDEDNDGNVYAGVYTMGSLSDAKIYKTSNNGATWSVIYYDPVARHVHDVKVDRYTNYLYAVIGDNMVPWNSAYIIRSTDGGANWTKILPSLPQMVSIGFSEDARFFGTDWSNGQIYKTTDDLTATKVFDTNSLSYCFWIRQDDLDDILYAGFCGHESQPRTAGIYYSIDDGETWLLQEDLQAPMAYDGTSGASNFKDGLLYCNIILNGVPINGFCIYPQYTWDQATEYPYLFSDGFESGDFDAWDDTGASGTSTLTVETNNPYQGSWNAKFISDGLDCWATKSVSGSPVLYYRQYIKVGNLPSSGGYTYLNGIAYEDPNNAVTAYIYNNSGHCYWGLLSTVNGVQYMVEESTPSDPQVDIYYYLEMCRDTTNGLNQLWVNNAIAVSASAPNFGNSNAIFTGILSSYAPVTVYFDNIKVGLSFIGPEEVFDSLIILNQPVNLSTIHTYACNFVYTPTWQNADIVSASLFVNGSLVQSNQSAVINGEANFFSYTFSENGTYVWNVQVSNGTHVVVANQNFVLTTSVDGSEPTPTPPPFPSLRFVFNGNMTATLQDSNDITKSVRKGGESK